MIQIVVLAHGGLAQALVETARELAGERAGVVALGLAPDETPERYAKRLTAVLAGGGLDGVLLLSDVLGGTPHRLAAEILLADGEFGAAVLVSGANLAMLLEALLQRPHCTSVAALASVVAAAGQTQIALGPQRAASRG